MLKLLLFIGLSWAFTDAAKTWSRKKVEFHAATVTGLDYERPLGASKQWSEVESEFGADDSCPPAQVISWLRIYFSPISNVMNLTIIVFKFVFLI